MEKTGTSLESRGKNLLPVVLVIFYPAIVYFAGWAEIRFQEAVSQVLHQYFQRALFTLEYDLQQMVWSVAMGIGAILFWTFASASWSNRGPRTTKGTLRLLRRISFGAAAMFTLTLLIWEDLALLSWPVILMIATADGWKCSIKESPEHFAPGVSDQGKL